jgi:nucleotide-binding universal stress UspA family protein
LHGLFVEDANLLRLCALPFNQEVGLLSATTRRLERSAVERQLRARASSLQQSMARIADAMRVPWSFQVTRGSVADELLAAAANAQLISLGSYQRAPGSQMGDAADAVIRQTPRPVLILGPQARLARPFTLVYTGSERAERALQFAIRLARRAERSLQVILPMTRGESEQAIIGLTETLAAHGIDARFVQSVDVSTLTRLLPATAIGTLILPAEYADQLSELNGPLILVP